MINSTSPSSPSSQAAQSKTPNVWDKIFDLKITNEEAEDTDLGHYIDNINYHIRTTGQEALDNPSLQKSFQALVGQLEFIRRVAQEEKAKFAPAAKHYNQTTQKTDTLYTKKQSERKVHSEEGGNTSPTDETTIGLYQKKTVEAVAPFSPNVTGVVRSLLDTLFGKEETEDTELQPVK